MLLKCHYMAVTHHLPLLSIFLWTLKHAKRVLLLSLRKKSVRRLLGKFVVGHSRNTLIYFLTPTWMSILRVRNVQGHFYRQKPPLQLNGTSTSTDGEKHAVDTSEAHNLDSKDPVPTSQGSFRSPKSIPLNIPSTPRTHKYCIVCQAKWTNRNRLCIIPFKARTQAFIEHILETGAA